MARIKAVDDGDDITKEVKRLGIEGKTANELAASGLHISLRDKLRKHALAVDLMRKAEGSGLEANTSRVQDSSIDVTMHARPSVEEVAVADDESEGDLQFFDP